MYRYLLTIFLVIALNLLSVICTYGQQNILDKKITIQFRDQTVKEAFRTLGAEVNYTVNYLTSDVSQNRKINKRFTKARVEDVIKAIWGNNNLEIRTFGNSIILQSSHRKPDKIDQGNLRGMVKGGDGQPLPGVTILLAGTRFGAVTDGMGNFSIKNIPYGTYSLVISSIGYEQTTQSVEINGKAINSSISLKESINELEEIVVYGKSNEQIKSEQPIKVEAINTRVLRAQSISLPQIINQTAGVRIRQAGGVGSRTTVNINGLQGRAIRYFKDGIPLDYLGRAFDLSILPVDQLSNVEIYKGVLPANLGADALGGAINFLTRDDTEDYLDVSHSFGSFSTHQSNLNGFWKIPDSKFHLELSSYFLTSQNNYENTAPVTNQQTQRSVPTKVERFHDAIQSGYAEIKFGLSDMKFADLLEIGGAFFDLEQELQNGLLLRNPYGEAMTTERVYGANVRFKKKINTLNIDVFGAYSDRQVDLIDTTNNRYTWFGEVFSTGPFVGGELNGGRKSLQTLDFETTQARVIVDYDLHDNHNLSLSSSLIVENRVGEDPFGSRLEDGEDVLSIPSKYTRNITGLGWNAKFLNGKLKNTLTAKHYGLSASALVNFVLDTIDTEPEIILDINNSNFGIGNSIKYEVNPSLFFRFSYEYATRIPETREYFGDGQFITPNVELRPETSHNVNTGFYKGFGQGNYSIDVNGFYRYVQENIFLRSNIGGIGRFLNLEDLRVRGVETTIRGKVIEAVSFVASVTWQDLRRFNLDPGSALENSRLPNVPFFFANANLRYGKQNPFGSEGKFEVYINYSFVEKYHLTPIPKAQESPLFGAVSAINNLLIPTQHVVDVGCTYKFSKPELWLNLEVNNLLNNEVFDNFRVPRPGINYRIKLRYLLKRNN
ncbi:MAG: TonB-dependent receptor [Bacteroidota bacterium]